MGVEHPNGTNMRDLSAAKLDMETYGDLKGPNKLQR